MVDRLLDSRTCRLLLLLTAPLAGLLVATATAAVAGLLVSSRE